MGGGGQNCPKFCPRGLYTPPYQIFIGIRRSKCEEEILHGTDWESVNYSLTKLQCNEDEITGLCVNDKYLVAQYHIEGGIDIYDRVTLKHLYR